MGTMEQNKQTVARVFDAFRAGDSTGSTISSSWTMSNTTRKHLSSQRRREDHRALGRPAADTGDDREWQ